MRGPSYLRPMHYRMLVCLLLLPDVAFANATSVLDSHACTACHSLDGRPSVGPTFKNLLGRTREVTTAGQPRSLVADEAYVRRSILEPDADLVRGWSAGSMPRQRIASKDLEGVVRAVLDAGGAATAPPAGERSALWLALATAAFVGFHFLLSSTGVRGPITRRLGERKFQGLYSLVVLLAFVWMIWAWIHAPYVELFRPPSSTRWLPNLVMPIAYVLLVAGFTTKNPGMAGMAEAARSGPVGIVKVTRHPALWGFALWGLAHLPANGDLRSLLLFGGIAVLAIGGMLHIDARRRQSGGETWRSFEAQTSLLPFGAIAAGKTRVTLREIGWWRIVAGIAAWAVMLHLHRLVIGVSPLPNP
jgi:uncharacterized membrane protein